MAPKKVYKWFRILTGILITALSIWLCFRNVDWAVLWRTIRGLNWIWVMAAVATSLLAVVLVSWRWKILLRPRGDVPGRLLFRWNVLSQFTNIVLPGRFGELLRVFLASRRQGIPGGFALGTVLIEKILDFILFIGLWVVVPTALAFRERVNGYAIGMVSGIALSILCVVIIGSPGVFRALIAFCARFFPRSKRPFVLENGERVIEAFAILRDTKAAGSVVAITFGSLLAQILPNYFLFLALGIDQSFGASLLVLLALQVGSLPPSAPGKIGIFEYSVILALGFFGVTREVALGYGLVLHLVSFLPKILLGMIYFIKMDIGRLKIGKYIPA